MLLPQSPNVDAVTDKSLDADDVEKLLGEEEIKEEETKKEEEEVEEEIEEEEEEVEEKEEEEKLETSPRKKELLKQYPDLFKKFPYLEKVIYRDREIQELFGSFDNAKEMAEKSGEVTEKLDILEHFNTQLLSGKTEDILKSVKDTDSKAFDKIVDDYLPALARIDKDAYLQVAGNVGKQIILEMVELAKQENDDTLKEAALILNKFLFNTTQLLQPTARVKKEEDNKDSELDKERRAFIQERFEIAKSDVDTRVNNYLTSIINDSIDPRKQMNGYMKRMAINDALDSLQGILDKDPALTRELNKFWRSAHVEKFSKASLDKIKSFYIAKAKNYLPSVIKKTRLEALKDLTPRSVKEEENEEIEEQEETITPRKKGPITTGRPHQTQSGKNDRKKGESVADFLMRD